MNSTNLTLNQIVYKFEGENLNDESIFDEIKFLNSDSLFLAMSNNEYYVVKITRTVNEFYSSLETITLSEIGKFSDYTKALEFNVILSLISYVQLSNMNFICDLLDIEENSTCPIS